jgi:hypothetical protein
MLYQAMEDVRRMFAHGQPLSKSRHYTTAVTAARKRLRPFLTSGSRRC